MASESVVQLGLLMALPMIMEIGLERGFRTALGEILIMQLQLAAVFFTLSLGTKVHYTIMGVPSCTVEPSIEPLDFVVRHEKFAENERMYSKSHFTKGPELMILLIVYNFSGSAVSGFTAYILMTGSMWFLVISWLFASFIFNPSGFEWQKIVEDWNDWTKWISSHAGIGVQATKSWWAEEQEHLQYTGFMGRSWEILLSPRFFLYQYGSFACGQWIKKHHGEPEKHLLWVQAFLFPPLTCFPKSFSSTNFFDSEALIDLSAFYISSSSNLLLGSRKSASVLPNKSLSVSTSPPP